MKTIMRFFLIAATLVMLGSINAKSQNTHNQTRSSSRIDLYHGADAADLSISILYCYGYNQSVVSYDVYLYDEQGNLCWEYSTERMSRGEMWGQDFRVKPGTYTVKAIGSFEEFEMQAHITVWGMCVFNWDEARWDRSYSYFEGE